MRQQECVMYLSYSILTHRLNAIRSVQLSWSFFWPLYLPSEGVVAAAFPPHNEETWEKTWSIIAGMTGLRILKVKLLVHDSWVGRSVHSEATLLAPLRAVKGLEVFEVEVSWPDQGGGYTTALNDVPYKIKRASNSAAFR